MFYIDYRDSVMDDVKEVIDNEGLVIRSQDDIDELVYNFDISGGRSGSYYCSRWAAESAIKDAIFDEDILSLMDEYEFDPWPYMRDQDYEMLDCAIREIILYSISWDDWADFLDIEEEDEEW